MDLLRWMWWMFARFVAVSVLILNAWMLLGHLTASDYRGWVYIWVMFSALAGAVGATLYLLTLDGPPSFRNRRIRLTGWVGMFVAVLLPTSLWLMLVPLVLALVPSLFMFPGKAEERSVTSA
jgi:hypothetical protein